MAYRKAVKIITIIQIYAQIQKSIPILLKRPTIFHAIRAMFLIESATYS